MRIDYESALRSISAAPLPMLYIDTCIFLDIVRSPVRDAIDARSSKIAQTLLIRANPSRRALWLVTSSTVETEWMDNIDAVFEETEREILKLEAKRSHFHSAAVAGTNAHHERGLIESSIDLAKRLRDLSKLLLNACLIIPPEAAHKLAAMKRLEQYLPPAERGKTELKDCEIYELFLALSRDLRGQSIMDQILFISSNTKEYSHSNGAGVQQELNNVSATYVASLIWAETRLSGHL